MHRTISINPLTRKKEIPIKLNEKSSPETTKCSVIQCTDVRTSEYMCFHLVYQWDFSRDRKKNVCMCWCAAYDLEMKGMWGEWMKWERVRGECGNKEGELKWKGGHVVVSEPSPHLAVGRCRPPAIFCFLSSPFGLFPPIPSVSFFLSTNKIKKSSKFLDHL